MEQKQTQLNNALEAKVVAANKNLTPAKKLNHEAKKWFEGNKGKLATLVGSHKEAQRMFLACMNSVAKNPLLLKAEPASIFKVLLQCAELKLYPGPMQEAAIVPYNNKKRGVLEAQFMPMYQGLVKLAYNSGFVRKLRANVVREYDDFDFVDGSETKLVHRPNADGGQRTHAYAVIELKYGDQHIVVMSAKQIEAIQHRSRASSESFSPWNSKDEGDVDWMWKKTVLKQALKLVPKSADLADAIERDNKVERPELAGNEALINFDDAIEIDELPGEGHEQN